jgi:hypothetical protein
MNQNLLGAHASASSGCFSPASRALLIQLIKTGQLRL